jgi:hypothetical protein
MMPYEMTSQGSSTTPPFTFLNTTENRKTDPNASQRIEALEAENLRLKLGLDIGLGGATVGAMGVAAGTYIYFSRQ